MRNLSQKLIRIKRHPLLKNLPRFQAHRGVWKNGATENTLAAFKEAKSCGFEMFECDVQLTKDHEVVCFHDADFKRLAGSSALLEELTLREAKDIFPQLTTLKEVLLSEEVPAWINIEIKTPRTLNESLERRVVQLIEKTKHAKNIIFSSFNPLSIWKLSQYAPQIPRAFLWSGENDPHNKIYLREMLVVPFLKVHLMHLDQKYLTPEEIKSWSRKGALALWTVNQDFSQYFDLGVNSIITDNPQP